MFYNMFPDYSCKLYGDGIAYLRIPAILRASEYKIIWKCLNTCGLPRGETASFSRVDIHITIKFHVRCNCFTYLCFDQFEIFILKYMIPVFIWHYISNRRM